MYLNLSLAEKCLSTRKDPTLGRFNEPKKRMSVTLKYEAHPQDCSLNWFYPTKLEIIFEKILNNGQLFAGTGQNLRFQEARHGQNRQKGLPHEKKRA